MHSSQHARGLLIAILGVLILSPDSLLIRLLKLDDFTLIFYRGLLPAFTITTILILYYRKRFLSVVLATGWAGILNACLFAATNITFINSIQKTSVANTLVILSSAPVFAAVLSFFILREKQRSITWIVMAMSMIGIFIIGFGSYQGDGLAGDLFALACALTTACSAVLVRLRKHIDLVPSVIFGSLMMALYAWMTAPIASVSNSQFIYIAIIGFVIVPLAFMCLTIAPRFAGSAEVQLVFLLEAILGPLWVWLVIRETPSTNTLLGGGILLVSVTWFAIKSLNNRKPA
jgi:drug/metabolite transporter (DMT)-like permease